MTKKVIKKAKNKGKKVPGGKLPVMVVSVGSQKAGVSAEEQIASLQTLLHNPGWGVVCGIFKQNVEVLQTQIIKKIDGEMGRVLTELEVDRLRDKLGYLEEVIDTPTNYIHKLRKEKTVPVSFDPFFRSVDEMKGRAYVPDGDPDEDGSLT